MAPGFAHVFDVNAATYGVPLLFRPMPVLTDGAMAARLGLPSPPPHWTWDTFLLYLSAAGPVMAAGPPGTTVLGLADLGDNGMLWLLLACLLAAEGVPLPDKPPWDTGSAGAQAAFGAWADLMGPYAGGGRFGTGTALMAIGTTARGAGRGAADGGTASGGAGGAVVTPPIIASYFPRLTRPVAPAEVWGLGARRQPELVARLAPGAQRALAVAMQASPVAQAAAGFNDWLPRGQALPHPVGPVIGMESGTEAMGSPGALSDPAFSSALYTLRRDDKRPAGRQAAAMALAEATNGLNTCRSCWTG